jgi:hypothetical protein
MDDPPLANFGQKGVQYRWYKNPAVAVDIFPQCAEHLDAAVTLNKYGLQFVRRG